MVMKRIERKKSLSNLQKRECNKTKMVNLADISVLKSCIDNILNQSPYHFSKVDIVNYIMIHQGSVEPTLLETILRTGKYHRVRIHNSGENYCLSDNFFQLQEFYK